MPLEECAGSVRARRQRREKPAFFYCLYRLPAEGVAQTKGVYSPHLPGEITYIRYTLTPIILPLLKLKQ